MKKIIILVGVVLVVFIIVACANNDTIVEPTPVPAPAPAPTATPTPTPVPTPSPTPTIELVETTVFLLEWTTEILKELTFRVPSEWRIDERNDTAITFRPTERDDEGFLHITALVDVSNQDVGDPELFLAERIELFEDDEAFISTDFIEYGLQIQGNYTVRWDLTNIVDGGEVRRKSYFILTDNFAYWVMLGIRDDSPDNIEAIFDFVVNSIVIEAIEEPESEVELEAGLETEPESEADAEAEPTPTPTETASQRNAIRAARNYINIMPFSRSGLIRQLEFEGYSNADAVHAVDNIGADWYEQAARKAQQYLDLMPFSRSGLIDQLVFDGFTRSQAAHGADAAGL